MSERQIEEYRALRATIRERGTARVWVTLAGLTAWAALSLLASTTTLASATLPPLIVLAAAFETVYALHTGVERVGRYLQVFFEEDGRGLPGWETVVMTPEGLLASGSHPLFTTYFWLAAALNLVPAAAAGPALFERALVLAAHAVLIGRIAVARARASTQRKRDLEAFRRIKSQLQSTP